MSSGPNRINPTPVRISSEVTAERATPRTAFGDRVKDNLANAAGTMAGAVGVAAQYIPGGAILSAALSGATNFATASSSGQAPSGARVGAYYMSGAAGSGSAVNVPGAVSSGGGTTGGVAGGGASPTLPVGGPAGGGGVGGMNVPGAGAMPNPMDVLAAQAASNMQFLTLQSQMQQENQRFNTLSNVMKTRHDTASNTIRNLH